MTTDGLCVHSCGDDSSMSTSGSRSIQKQNGHKSPKTLELPRITIQMHARDFAAIEPLVQHGAVKYGAIREARRIMGFTQEELAATLGVTPNTLGRLEQGLLSGRQTKTYAMMIVGLIFSASLQD